MIVSGRFHKKIKSLKIIQKHVTFFFLSVKSVTFFK